MLSGKRNLLFITGDYLASLHMICTPEHADRSTNRHREKISGMQTVTLKNIICFLSWNRFPSALANLEEAAGSDRIDDQ